MDAPTLRVAQVQPYTRQFLTQDPGLLRELDEFFRVARPRRGKAVPVLINGETGVGKSLLAVDTHEESRPGQELKIVDGTSLEPGIVNSELFGHERGAFTGAVTTHRGLIEAADRGTLFLDEIALLPGEVQAKLMRAIQDGLCRKVGGTADYKVDVRWIFATNADLAQLVADEKFREDLYYRLCVASIEIPPLRDRPGDIALIAGAYLKSIDIAPELLSAQALAKLEEHPWYGNVRELRAVLDTAVRRADEEIRADHIRFIKTPPKPIKANPRAGFVEVQIGSSWRAAQDALYSETLKLCGGNVRQAARLLEIVPSTLSRWKTKRG